MRLSRIAPFVLAVAATASLAGCTASVSLTASPESIAGLAEDALEQQIGLRPEIDCGDEGIALREGNTVPCILTDPGTGTRFDAEVTLSEVDGTDVTVSVQVAETPLG